MWFYARAAVAARRIESVSRSSALARSGWKTRGCAGHITDLFSAAAVEVVQGAARAGSPPFFLWLAYNAPHTPWYAAPQYREAYDNKDPTALAPPAHPKSAKPFDWATYYSVITHLDEAVGRVVAEIDRAGLWDNTYVFFIGDNGYMCGTKGENGKVVPWEESVRVPLLGCRRQGASGREIRLAGEFHRSSRDVDGTCRRQARLSFVGQKSRDLLKAGKGGPDEGFTSWVDGRPEALAVNRAVEPYRLVRTRTHKLIVWESGRQALYDYRADPGEEHDLAERPEFAKTMVKLRGRLIARMKETQDPAAAWIKTS